MENGGTDTRRFFLLILLINRILHPSFYRMLCLFSSASGIIFLLLSLMSCIEPIRYDDRTETILQQLDEAIINQTTYEQIKEQRISSIKGLLRNIDSPRQVYSIYDNLYEEYYRYDLDSAMQYAHRKLILATEMNDKTFKDKSKLDVGKVFLMAGMIIEAKDLLGSINFKELDPALRINYYSAYHTLYQEMKAISLFPSKSAIYEEKGDSCLQQVYELLEGDPIRKILIDATLKREAGDNQWIVDSLLIPLQHEKTSPHHKADLVYMLAQAYQEMGDTNNAIYYYAESALYDIYTPLCEPVAIYTLASILYENGDIERAYQYINSSISDTRKVNFRENAYHMNQLLPLISQSYNAKIEQQQNKLILLAGAVSLLMILLVIAIIVICTSLKRVSATRKEQNRMDAELKKVNSQLLAMSNILLENNHIKEAYIGRYLDLCSNYINGVENYRTHLYNILRRDGGSEVLKNIRSSAYIKEELEEFYSNFDATFLHIFPNFVEQFNSLLQQGKRITLKQGELLNTELRIYALIRLGVSDSVKIAEFLRSSISTIYNYRVKMRNAAINDKQDFEKQVINIGSL